MATTCYGSDDERQILASIRTSVSGICALICLAALVIMCVFMKWRLFLHRILMYFTVATLAYLVVYCAQIIAIWSDEKNVEKACKWAGGFNQFTSWLQMEFAICMALYILYLYCHNIWHAGGNEKLWEPPKCGDCGVILLTVVIALGFSLIPLAHDTYGLIGGWCWIRDRHMKGNECKDYQPGIVQHWALWWAWLLLAAVSMALMLIVGVALTCCMAVRYKFRTANEFFKKQTRRMMFVLFLYLGVYLLFTIVEVVLRFLNSINNHFNLGEWITIATISPIVGVFLPVMFLIHLYHVGKFGRKLDDSGTEDQDPECKPIISGTH